MLNFLVYLLGGFHVFISVFYHVNLELLVYLDFQGIMILLLSILLLNIHTFFFCDAPKPGGPLTNRQPTKLVGIE